jgi:hypothetical protein
MQATQTATIRTIEALRAISELSVYRTRTTTPVLPRPTVDTPNTAQDAEAWSRRAAHANGFGEAGFQSANG